MTAVNSYDIFAPLMGTYRGFAPTDESPIAMGELEIVVDATELTVRHATGLEIQRAEIGLNELKAIPRELIHAILGEQPGVDAYVAKVTGFQIGAMQYFFCPEGNEEEPGLFIRGNELSDFLGPTVLWSPKQIEQGQYAAVLADTERQFGKNSFPTLAAGGKLPE